MTQVVLPAPPKVKERHLFATAAAISIPLLTLVAIFKPRSPDLIAQLARTALEKSTQGASWWTSWYGGLLTPSYSVLSPTLMNVAGIWVIGILSAAVTIFASVRMLSGVERGRLALALISVATVANIVSGRTTFALGIAFAALSLLAFTRKAPVVAAVFASLSWLGSPLAGLFLVLLMAGAAFNPSQRRGALLVASAAGVTGLIIEVAFPVAGHMPMGAWQLIFALSTCAVVAFSKTNPFTKRLSLLVALATIAFFITGSPVGGNMLRLPMLYGAAAIVATSKLRAKLLAPIVGLFVVWMTANCIMDLRGGADPSYEASFYKPLIAQLPAAGTAQNRIEVVDPVSHGPALYVASVMPLARGWERQVDVTRNSIFYDKALTADTYRKWLDVNAVRWVALPNTELDYSSKAESALLQTSLPYLTKTWTSEDWTLYEVTDPVPLVTGVASLNKIGQSEILLNAAQSGEGLLKVQWSPRLSLVSTDGLNRADISQDGTGIHYSIPAAGTYRLGVDL